MATYNIKNQHNYIIKTILNAKRLICESFLSKTIDPENDTDEILTKRFDIIYLSIEKYQDISGYTNSQIEDSDFEFESAPEAVRVRISYDNYDWKNDIISWEFKTYKEFTNFEFNLPEILRVCKCGSVVIRAEHSFATRRLVRATQIECEASSSASIWCDNCAPYVETGEENCCICMDNEPQPWCQPCCGHKFHKLCYDKIKGESGSVKRKCPLCREKDSYVQMGLKCIKIK